MKKKIEKKNYIPDILFPDELLNLFDSSIEIWHTLKKIDLIKITTGNRVLRNLIVKLLYHNYTLWHLEDRARVKDCSPEIIAQVKHSIDKENQSRNDTIESIDIYISSILSRDKDISRRKKKTVTETLGSVIDRLSIISLKIYHTLEETNRKDATSAHKEKCLERFKRLTALRIFVSKAYSNVLTEIFAGKTEHFVFSQLKMYNDPSLNPELYRKK